MRSTFPILICCLYALIAVDATPFSKRGNAEVQQGNAKAAKPLNFGLMIRIITMTWMTSGARMANMAITTMKVTVITIVLPVRFPF